MAVVCDAALVGDQGVGGWGVTQTPEHRFSLFFANVGTLDAPIVCYRFVKWS